MGQWIATLMKVFVQQCLVPQLWSGAVVGDGQPDSPQRYQIEPLLHAVGARLLNLSPYSPDFNPIELWWSLLLAFYVSSHRRLRIRLTSCWRLRSI
jgi:hypothetical protein